MERSLLSALAGTLLGISALGSAAFVLAGSGSPGSQPKPEGDWRLLDPITYENISIFPVISSVSRDTSAFVTLDEGLSSGEVIVREQGSDGMARSRGVALPQYNTSASVNQLVLINRGKRPVVLLAGELVSGGKQDRIISKDRIVAPGSDPLPLDVFCVEHGRWSSGLQFSAANTMVHPSVREQAAVNQSQTEVWDSVRKGTTAILALRVPLRHRVSLQENSLTPWPALQHSLTQKFINTAKLAFLSMISSMKYSGALLARLRAARVNTLSGW